MKGSGPIKSCHILKSDAYPWLNACINFASNQAELYTSGYKRAAEILIDYVLRERINLDTLVYPILFLYRQCIELQLKNLIKCGSELLDSPKEAPNTHDLRCLWEQCKGILEKIFDDESDPIKKIETIVLKLAEIDPRSQAFRYPKDRKGSKSLAGITHINFKKISDLFGETVGLLDGAETLISEYLSNKYLEY